MFHEDTLFLAGFTRECNFSWKKSTSEDKLDEVSRIAFSRSMEKCLHEKIETEYFEEEERIVR